VVVTTDHEKATYELLDGPPMTVSHHGEEIDLRRKAVSRPVPVPPQLPRPSQPPGRAPARRGAHINGLPT
jgi:alpha,alpha-trehalose phosphorylase